MAPKRKGANTSSHGQKNSTKNGGRKSSNRGIATATHCLQSHAQQKHNKMNKIMAAATNRTSARRFPYKRDPFNKRIKTLTNNAITITDHLCLTRTARITKSDGPLESWGQPYRLALLSVLPYASLDGARQDSYFHEVPQSAHVFVVLNIATFAENSSNLNVVRFLLVCMESVVKSLFVSVVEDLSSLDEINVLQDQK